MQIKIDLPPDLEQDLIRQAEQSKVPLQTIILQALRQTTQRSTPHWSEIILSYEANPDFPAFESYRDELRPPRDPDLSPRFNTWV